MSNQTNPLRARWSPMHSTTLAYRPAAMLLPAEDAAAEESAPETRERTTTMDVEALYRRYGDMVLGRCRTLLGNDADAQETTQEIFLKLHRYRDRFRGDASPTTYLFKVTTTTCLNKLRSRRRRPEDPVEDFSTVAINDAFLPPLEVRDLVARVLDLADEGTQICVLYHYVDGMTYDEIGEILGLSGAAVRKRVSKFRAALRDNPPAWLDEVPP